MGYRTLRDCVLDLRAGGQLVVVDEPVDPHLEMAEVQRRLFRAGGPAVLFTAPKGVRVPHARQPLRHDGADALPLPRHAGRRPAAGRLAGRSGRRPAAAAALSEDAVDGLERPAAAGVARRRCWPSRPRIDRLAAIEVLARRRRPLHHPAAGLHRGPGPAGPGPLEPGHVSRAAWPAGNTSTNREVGPALPDSSAASAPIMPPPSAARSGCG